MEDKWFHIAGISLSGTHAFPRNLLRLGGEHGGNILRFLMLRCCKSFLDNGMTIARDNEIYKSCLLSL